jgi:DNA-binding transcriptional LysR family regulator
MDHLKNLRAFVAVARCGGFASGARELGLSTSSISRQVAELEDWLGTDLLRRTTRRLSLTDPGSRFLQRCEDILENFDDLKREARALEAEPQGILKITASAFPARHLITPHLPAFLRRFSRIKLRMALEDEAIDLVEEGMDLAIRIGRLPESQLVSRKIGEIRLLLTATPQFLSQNREPKAVEDLRQLPCLVDTIPGHQERWPLGKGIRVDGPLFANSGEMIREMTLADLGVSLLPDFFVERDVREGRLVRLLEEELPDPVGIYALYPPRRQISSGARAFVEHLTNELSGGRNDAGRSDSIQ